MVMKTPTFAEEEKLDTMTSFVLKPSALKEFIIACKTASINRSEALRFMVTLFLNDPAFQERVLKGAKNNG